MTDAKALQSTTRFDWWIVLLSGWMLAGLYVDGWAHRHIRDLDTFFTPWHGVLYSGFIAVFAFFGIILVRNHARGWPWHESMPAGYGLSVVGLFVFAGGGVGDLIWHTLFGIEVDLEALLSPTHLILAIGAVLIGAGPFRAAWRRTDRHTPASLIDLLPMLLSLTYGLSILTFFTQFAHSFVHPWAAGPRPEAAFFMQSLELTGILVQSAFMIGLILLIVWRWTLPFGSLTLVFTLNSFLMSTLEEHLHFVSVGILSGLIADGLAHWLKPAKERSWNFRLFAAAVPAIFYTTYFLVVGLTDGIWWSIHMWTGAIVLAGIVGWLLSYLIVPPAMHGVRRE